MSREAVTDPEIIADMQFRSRSELDRSRTGRAANPFDATPVEQWPCRKCGVLVGVTRAAIDAFTTCNAQLRRCGEDPIAKDRVMWCPACRQRDAALERETRTPRRHPEQLEPGTAPPRPSGMRPSNKPRRKI